MGKKKKDSSKDNKEAKSNIKKGKRTAIANDKKKSKKKADKKSKKDKAGKSKHSVTMKPQATKISHEERLEMIRTAAYYLAQKRSYQAKSELDDLISAEKGIEGIISEDEN